MKAKSIIFLIAFILLSVKVMAEDADNTGNVASCFDGDTLQLVDRRIVRLAGIDAPEKPRGSNNAQYYSRQAKKDLEELVKGQQINIISPGVKPKDKYGRHLAELVLPDGTSINEEMVGKGAAFFYPHEDLKPDFQERLARRQAEAIKKKRGFWEHVLSLPIAEAQYIGDRETLRFYPAECAAVQQIKPRSRIVFDTLMDAFMEGYAPARVCVFWPEEK